ncbi:protein of unknown function [Pseudomonas mediterranea]
MILQYQCSILIARLNEYTRMRQGATNQLRYGYPHGLHTHQGHGIRTAPRLRRAHLPASSTGKASR